MSERTLGKDLRVGDTIDVWWSPNRDTITALRPYVGPYQSTVPKVAVLAMEALVRRQNPRNAELHPKMLLLKFRDKDSFALFELMADKVKGMEILYASPEDGKA